MEAHGIDDGPLLTQTNISRKKAKKWARKEVATDAPEGMWSVKIGFCFGFSFGFGVSYPKCSRVFMW